MSFTFSKGMNPPTVFLAKRSELGDRFDPEMVLFRRKANQFKYPAVRMNSFFSEPPQYGAGERGLAREDDAQPRYIRITDINEYGILTDELGATAATIEPRYILGEDDMLIARSGNTVGKSYLHKRVHAPATCFFAGYLIRFRFRRHEILPDYAFAFTQLPYYKEWVRAIQRAAGQPNINAQEYSNLELPAAPISVQKKVVSLLNDAYVGKRKRDEDARKLLQSIDDLLLDELGIPRKAEPPSTLEGRIFRRDFSTVSGKRIDPAANWKRLSLDGGKFSLCRLRDVASINPITRFPKLALGTPTHGHDTNYPTSGGGPEFERFLNEELAPAIDAKYRTVPCRILVGHSLGGALVFDSFLRQTNGFHALIAIDPSLWWDDQVLVHRAAEFSLHTNSQISLFIASATAPPSADRTNLMIAPAQHVVSLLTSNAPPGLRVGYQLLEAEDHNSSRLLGLYRGLRFIFDGYKPIDFAGLDTPVSIISHFAQLSVRLGYQILPPAHFVDDVGHALLDAHETDKAIECFKLNLTNYPTLPYAYVHLADAYSAKGDKASAIQNYQKALALDPTRDDAKAGLKKLK